jgi:hypothetical protein
LSECFIDGAFIVRDVNVFGPFVILLVPSGGYVFQIDYAADELSVLAQSLRRNNIRGVRADFISLRTSSLDGRFMMH